MAIVLHVNYGVPPELMYAEIRFWWALGFERVTRPEPKYRGNWLCSGKVYVYLQPNGLRRLQKTDEHDHNHIAIVPRHGFANALRRLEEQPFTTEVEMAELYWGARRVFISSPAGYRVELVEFSPPARYTGPPETD